jgi:hypothetical protein
MTTELENYMSELGLDEHREHLLRIARPSVQIIAADVPVTVRSVDSAV